jgi:glucose/arabinose dehydrogenase
VFQRVTAGLMLAALGVLMPTRLVAQTFSDELVISGFNLPVGFVTLPDGRALIAQKDGLVRLVKNGVLQPTPFIDLRARVNDYWDRGMVGIAVDPVFATTGYLYLYYVYEHNAADYSGPKSARLTRVSPVSIWASDGSPPVESTQICPRDGLSNETWVSGAATPSGS